MEPDVSFVGVKLLPGKLTKVGGTTNPDSSIWTIHITQFALAAGAKAGKNIITLVESTGDSFALGTLEKDRCEQFQVRSEPMYHKHAFARNKQKQRALDCHAFRDTKVPDRIIH